MSYNGEIDRLNSVVDTLSSAIRRLKDSGKENYLWIICAFIPIYNLYLFAQPTLKDN